MQIIDVHDLALVTGGTQAAPQPAAGQAGAAPQQGAAPGAGGFLSGLQQFFGFLQSPAFQQIIGGFQQIISSFGQGGAQPGAQPGGAQPAAGAAGPQPQA